MKIVEFKCPACGANLKADMSRGIMFCEYCGKKLILDDEAVHIKMSIDNAQEAGFEFEQGRMNAQSSSAQAEAEKLQRMISALPECDRLKSRYNMLAIQSRAENGKHVDIAPMLGWIVLCLFFARLIQLNLELLIRTHDPSRIIVMLVSAGAIALIVRSQYFKHINIRKKAEETKKQKDDTMAALNAILRESGLDSIPEEYRTMDCLNYLHSALISRAAFTIPQAIHSYELYQHQLELAEQNRQQLEIQRQQLEEMQALREKMDKKDDNDDGSALGTIAAIGLGVLVGRSVFKK